MSKVIIELSAEQLGQAIESLPEREKLKLTERLERETFGLRWRQILSHIDARLKKFPVPKETVLKEIQAYRKHKYA